MKGVTESNELRVYNEAFEPSTYFGIECAKNNLWSVGDMYISDEETTDESYKTIHFARFYTEHSHDPFYEIIDLLSCAQRYECQTLLIFNSSRTLISLNDDMTIGWQRVFPQVNGYFKGDFFKYKNNFIVSAGTMTGQDHSGQLLYLDADTGATLWQRDLPFSIYFCTMVGDRVYLSSQCDWHWCVLCADTGDILLQDSYVIKHEMDTMGWLWGDSGYIFLSYGENILRIMDEVTGEIVQDVPIPEDFSLSNTSHPIVNDDFIYIRLSNGGGIEKIHTYGGVIILPREELKQGFPLTIEVEDKGDISHQAIADGKTEYYEITASYEELGDVLRFGQIEIKLVAHRFAYHQLGNLDNDWKTRINKKFDGRMVFNVDKAKLKNPDDSKFDLMVELFNKHFAEKFRAPANKKPLTIEWRYI
ncbi:MAG: hypothetical protein CMI04_10075 [Oceanospirillaceae bacterium]|nr:hypothetical protein [Oceanospirillaceae bacterium]